MSNHNANIIGVDVSGEHLDGHRLRDGESRRFANDGRGIVRRTLLMGAWSASQRNPDLAAFHQRLLSAGKPRKVAQVAVVRKLVILANLLIEQDRLWQPTRPQPASA